MALPNWFVCLIGMGIVFLGLICIVAICSLMGAICKHIPDNSKKSQAEAPASFAEEIPNRQEFIAAVSAAIAEEMGADISAIRIVSVKRS